MRPSKCPVRDMSFEHLDLRVFLEGPISARGKFT